MPGKMVVLKPVVWSPNGYVFPAGIVKKGKDYVATHGFGNEEWNGDQKRFWKGQRVFHTESKGRMEEAGRRGELGIIMTAYAHSGGISGPHAVGVATSVQLNTKEERREIAKTVKAADHAQAMWRLESIRRKFGSYSEFKAFWEQDACEWIRWRCPRNQYAWFETPVSLSAPELFPPRSPGGSSPEIIKMFSAFMPITREQALSVVWHSLESDSPIINWLLAGEFDENSLARKTKSYRTPIPSNGPRNRGSAPPATDPYTRYMQAREIVVTPRHHEVQKRFEAYIGENGASNILADRDGVDVQFRLSGRGHVLAEIKPCNVSEARFAVRTAMGQLLDYEQRSATKSPGLLIVLEVKPSDEEVELALSNGFGIAYARGQNFVLKWPT